VEHRLKHCLCDCVACRKRRNCVVFPSGQSVAWLCVPCLKAMLAFAEEEGIT